MTVLEALKVWIADHYYGEVDDETLSADAAACLWSLEHSGFTIKAIEPTHTDGATKP